MSPDIAAASVDRFAELFDPMAVVNFFGGEPALNLPAIRAAGSAVDRLVDRGALSERPHLSMATNGTIASREFIDAVNRYRIRFAVSVDGPRELHDLQRRGRSGNGSYGLIKDNIKRLQEATGYPKGIAFTYTVQHLKSTKTLWQMLSELRDELGIRQFAVMPATNSPATPGQWDPLVEDAEKFIEEYREALRNSLRELANSSNPVSIEYGRNSLASLVEPPHYDECPAGESYFSVSAEGDVFPCQNLPEQPGYRITNVRRATFVQELRSSMIRKQIEEANRRAIEQIGACESRSMCRICPSDNIGETGSLTTYSPRRFELYKAIDQVTREAFVEIMSGSDDASRERFLANLRA